MSLRLHYFVIAFIAALLTTFIISYGVAATNGHVSILFPYISDTGTMPPESCAFSLLLSISAFLSVICAYSWYKHECEYFDMNPDVEPRLYFARSTFLFGMGSSLGLLVVASFQEKNQLLVHLIGALMTFGCGTLYAIMLTHASRTYLIVPRWLFVVRCASTVTITLSFVSVFLFAGLAGFPHRFPPEKWVPSDKGYTYHLLSCAAEWIMAIGLVIIFSSLIYELRDYTLEPVRIRLHIYRPPEQPQQRDAGEEDQRHILA